MINGTHLLLYSDDPEADRAFMRDILKLRSVDAGEGWLIFALPPAELGIHPAEGETAQGHAGHKMIGAVLYLMCDNLREVIKQLESRKVKCGKVEKAPWGSVTTIRLPSGGEIGLYQPTHPTAIDMDRD